MNNSVLDQLSALPGKSTQELSQLWRDLYQHEPPSHSRGFLIKRLAYRLQELHFGGFSQRAEAKLDRLIEEEDRRVKGKSPARKGIRLMPGTRLERSWRGVLHAVTVLDDGFEHQGRKYRSLSAVAREIAQSRWNGWVFFGLKDQRSAK